jgi:hypothetical protein
MNQKKPITIIIILATVVILGSAGAYFALNQPNHLNPPSSISDLSASEPIVISGKTTCLTKKNPGQQTLECSIGLQATDGRQYALKGNYDPEYKFAQVGLDVQVSGMLFPEKKETTDGNLYKIVGTIDVSSIIKVNKNNQTIPKTSNPNHNSPEDGSNNTPPSSNCVITIPKPATLCPKDGIWDFVPTDSDCHGSWQCVIPL